LKKISHAAAQRRSEDLEDILVLCGFRCAVAPPREKLS